MTSVTRPPSSGPAPVGLTAIQVPVSDPRVRPLLRELGHEYSTRYGKDAHAELARYPDEEFTTPRGGVLLLLLEDGEPVAGGAFRRYDATTAELKRIWTHSAHRRRGLARRVVAELEREAAARGYRRIYLTTGPRQPEARGLYLATGYTPLFDTEADPETIGPLPFEKHLTPVAAADRGRPDATPIDATPVDAIEADHARPDRDDLASLKVVPTRHYARWAAALAVLVVSVQFLHGLVTNPVWQWRVFGEYVLSETIVTAVGVTLQLTAYSTLLGFALGTVLAFMRLSAGPVLRTVAWTYVWIFRSIPMIVQLVFWFNLGALYRELGIGIPFGPVFWSVSSNDLIGTIGAALIGLSLHQAAYCAEIVRGGVLSVDQGQLEAAAALGIPKLRQIRRIVLPQAMRTILPTAGSEIISLLKGTSVVYVMAIGELFYQVKVIYGRNGMVIPLLMVATAWYVFLTSVLSVAQYYVERHYARGAERTPPPTPLERARRFLAGLRAAAAQRRRPAAPLGGGHG
ncbi:GNAT family N-acetyltransferase [Streptomyces sparsogenes]|uniref:GNAT family N-acetyltransferase n=1 Tax=Streptomyces sparsogenes TaxID=67365 RepID=UPI003850F23D